MRQGLEYPFLLCLDEQVNKEALSNLTLLQNLN